MAVNLERAAGALIGRVFPGEMLLSSRIGDWYKRNEFHKRHPGDVLVLRGHAGGFGRRPVAVVLDYHMDSNLKVGFYTVDMYRDQVMDPELDLEVRTVDVEEHSKWNIENLFRKVGNGVSPEKAVQLYKARTSLSR